jgi:hypothetical protein
MKIRQQVNVTINAKMRQLADGGSSTKRQKKKRVSSGIIVEEDERPRKSRRLEQVESILPQGKQLENSTTIMKEPEIDSTAQDVRDVVELKSIYPLGKKLRISSISSRTSDNSRNKEEDIKFLDTTDHVTSSVHVESTQRQEARQKSLTLSHPGDAVPTSTVSTETSHHEVPSIPDDMTVKFTEGIKPRKSVSDSCVHEVNSPMCDRPQATKSSIHSPHDIFSDINENNSVVTKINSECGGKETEPSSCDTECCADKISEPVHQSAMEGTLSEKETLVNEDKTGPDATFTKTSENPQSNGICAKVMNVEVDQPNKGHESVSEQWAMSHSKHALQSSPSKKKLQKSTQVFRYVV